MTDDMIALAARAIRSLAKNDNDWQVVELARDVVTAERALQVAQSRFRMVMYNVEKGKTMDQVRAETREARAR